MVFLEMVFQVFQVFHDLYEGAVAPKRTWAWDVEPSFLFKKSSFYNINNQ